MAQRRITFSLRKKNAPREPEMFYIMFDCYHLNPAQIRTLSVLPGPWARPGPVQISSLYDGEGQTNRMRHDVARGHAVNCAKLLKMQHGKLFKGTS
jgi:hypothetical protein